MDLEGRLLDIHLISMQAPVKSEYKMGKWKHLVSKKILFDGIDKEYDWGIGLKVDKLIETNKGAAYLSLSLKGAENFLLEALFAVIMTCHIHKDYIAKTNADAHK